MTNQQEIIAQINQLLEKDIRPRIQMDGGDIRRHVGVILSGSTAWYPFIDN